MIVFDLIYKKLKSERFTIEKNKPLSGYTTIGIGGPARLCVEVHKWQLLEKVISIAIAEKIPYVVLGKGSNIIISDKGYNGLIIINKASGWKILDEDPGNLMINLPMNTRFNLSEVKVTNLIAELDSDKDADNVIVRVESGTLLSLLIKSLLKKNITGLQWFAGIPSSVGGAIYMNLHGGQHFFGNLVKSALLLNGCERKEVTQEYFQFEYDWSILHKTKEIILYADLFLKKGDIIKARQIVRDWADYKANQPKRSAGCIFKNISVEKQKQYGFPTTSVGYIIDNVLELKGMQKGGAVISNKHAAFIENPGRATAADVAFLIDYVKQEAWNKLGLELELEIEMIGDF